MGFAASVRMLFQAGAVLAVLAGLAFGVQAAVLHRPSHAQLLAVDALNTLARYQTMSGTENTDARSLRSICLENRVFDRKTDSVVLGSFVLVGKRERFYDLGRGLHVVGRHEPRYAVARSRFLLAGCPAFLVARLGAVLARLHAVGIDTVNADGVAAYRIRFSYVKHALELYVDRRTLTPLELALGPGASAPHSDLEPNLAKAQATLIDRVVPAALRRRAHRG